MVATLDVGTEASFTKTVGETDIYMFAGITGDFSPNHVNDMQMRETVYGGRIAHDALIVGYMSTASTKILEKNAGNSSPNLTPVSVGYDHIRFLKAVCIGDTIKVSYKIVKVDNKKNRTIADIEVSNQRGELVTVASHIMQWVANSNANNRALG